LNCASDIVPLRWFVGRIRQSAEGSSTRLNIFARRSLDFWRIGAGCIRQNRVMVDMIDLYRQVGTDVFARMAALTGTDAQHVSPLKQKEAVA